MRKLMMAAGLCAALAACGQQEAAPADNGSEQLPAALNPGDYEVTTLVQSLRSTDGTPPATKAKASATGDKPIVHRACVGSDGTVEPVMFSEAGDECRIENAYARNGRLQLNLSCTRPGSPGQVMQSVNGKFTADGFEATVETGTYFTGAGDYQMRRQMTGKRTGDCTVKEDKKS
jgi:hypothetical protein